TLNLSTIELTSTLREASLNGAPSSQDYNDSQSENLVDLASIVSFINDQLLLILNALPAAASSGLTGETIYSDTSDNTNLFFNSSTQTPLVVADSLRYLQAAITNLSTQVADLGVDVTTLQTRITASSQNDIVQQLSTIQNTISTIQSQLYNNINNTAKSEAVRQATGSIPAGTTVVVAVTWPTPFASNNYTPTANILGDATNSLEVVGMEYSVSAGQGIVVSVLNVGATGSASGTIYAAAKAD